MFNLKLIHFLKWSHTYLSKLLSEKENLLKKYPQLKNIQEDLSRTEVYEYWSNRNTDLAYVRDFVLNAIEELHSVFINGQINKEFNNALEEIAELRFSRESHYFNLIISKWLQFIIYAGEKTALIEIHWTDKHKNQYLYRINQFISIKRNTA